MGKKIKPTTSITGKGMDPEWMPVFKIPASTFVVSKSKPVSVFDKLEAMYAKYIGSDGGSITDIAVSQDTYKRIRDAAHAYTKAKYPGLSTGSVKSTVSMALLNHGPVELPKGAIENTLYIKLDAIRSGRITIK